MFKILFEDVFIYDDFLADLRKKDLVTALNSITANAQTLSEIYGNDSDQNQNVDNQLNVNLILTMIRANPHNDGWLERWTADSKQLFQAWLDQVDEILKDEYVNSHAIS